eukprot:5946628-Amphidinium_carterae.1
MYYQIKNIITHGRRAAATKTSTATTRTRFSSEYVYLIYVLNHIRTTTSSWRWAIANNIYLIGPSNYLPPLSQ